MPPPPGRFFLDNRPPEANRLRLRKQREKSPNDISDMSQKQKNTNETPTKTETKKNPKTISVFRFDWMDGWRGWKWLTSSAVCRGRLGSYAARSPYVRRMPGSDCYRPGRCRRCCCSGSGCCCGRGRHARRRTCHRRAPASPVVARGAFRGPSPAPPASG